MDRNQVISKIKSMLKLQESTDFDGEASAAAQMIDKLYSSGSNRSYCA
jgi:hypothetical protein